MLGYKQAEKSRLGDQTVKAMEAALSQSENTLLYVCTAPELTLFTLLRKSQTIRDARTGSFREFTKKVPEE